MFADTSDCESDMFMYFPFNDDMHDATCTGALSEQVGGGTVKLVSDDERGKVVEFDGAALKVCLV